MGNLADLLLSRASTTRRSRCSAARLREGRRRYGTAHPDTLYTVKNLAILLDAKGDAAAARELRAAYGVEEDDDEDEEEEEGEEAEEEEEANAWA